MKGAIVFLAVFAIVFLISLGVTQLPPGQALCDMLNLPAEAAAKKVGGAIYSDVLIKTIFNTVI